MLYMSSHCCVTVTPDGKYIVSGSGDRSILIWPTTDVNTDQPFYTLRSAPLPYGCLKNITYHPQALQEHIALCVNDCNDDGDSIVLSAIREANMNVIDIILFKSPKAHLSLSGLYFQLCISRDSTMRETGSICCTEYKK